MVDQHDYAKLAEELLRIGVAPGSVTATEWLYSHWDEILAALRVAAHKNGDAKHRRDATYGSFFDVVFDGPPGPQCGRFIEVENEYRASISIGEWIKRPDGYWVLRIRRSAVSEIESIPAGHCSLYVPQGTPCAMSGYCRESEPSEKAAGPAPVSAIHEPVVLADENGLTAVGRLVASVEERALKAERELAAAAVEIERLRAGWIESDKIALEARMKDAAQSASDATDYKALYHELIYQVGNKWPGETRHQTALRYLRQAENNSDNRASPDSGAKHEL